MPFLIAFMSLIAKGWESILFFNLACVITYVNIVVFLVGSYSTAEVHICKLHLLFEFKSVLNFNLHASKISSFLLFFYLDSFENKAGSRHPDVHFTA